MNNADDRPSLAYGINRIMGDDVSFAMLQQTHHGFPIT